MKKAISNHLLQLNTEFSYIPNMICLYVYCFLKKLLFRFYMNKLKKLSINY